MFEWEKDTWNVIELFMNRIENSSTHLVFHQIASYNNFVQKELPIHISNLIYKDPDSGKSGRVKIEKLSDGASSRVVVESKKSEGK